MNQFSREAAKILLPTGNALSRRNIEEPKYRVGWGLAAPASHTTVRAVRHTAVHERLIKLRYFIRKLTSPCSPNHLTGTAAFMWEAPAFHHGP
jgi:hypothetical protein